MIHRAQRNGGDDRDRTDDPLLAKQVLSQLSYAPASTAPPGGFRLRIRFAAASRRRREQTKWAREDSNLRPHAYQACALTN